MDILVISDEPALGETLASELPEFTLAQAGTQEARARLASGSFRLVLADTQAETPDTGAATCIALSRPVRLSDLLYTIRLRLQGKSGAARADIALAPGFSFSASERVIRPENGAAQIPLTEKEGELLLCLLESRDTALPREALLKRVWGYGDAITTHTLETHIYRLRGKLRQARETFDIAFSEEAGYRLDLI